MQHTKKVATFSSLFNKRLLFGGLFALLTTFALQAQTTRYVKATAAGSGDGTSWANASADLQAIINASAVNDQVWVAAGTYKPTNKPYENGVEITTTHARDKTFHVKDGVKIYGGFSASTPESTLAARNISTNVTTLSGDFNSDDVVTGSGATLSITGNTENAYHVVLSSAAEIGGIGVTINGFTVKGGNANDANYNSITVNGNILYRNGGGGIYTYAGTNTLSNNTLSGNAASTLGGGIYTRDGTNTLSNNTLSGNVASLEGGGIYTRDGTNTLSNNTLSGNAASIGGGIYTRNGTNTLGNNTLSGNAASSRGGGIYTSEGTTTLSNNTLSGNAATYNGGGIAINYGINTLSNNIFWENKKGTANNVAGADYIAYGTNGNTFNNNLLQLASGSYTDVDFNGLGTGASGNLFAQNPLFVSATDLRLQATSPCINKGITGTGIPTKDITGTTRVGIPDLGAYEYFAPACTAPSITAAASSNSPINTGATLNLTVTAAGTAPLTYTWSGKVLLPVAQALRQA